MSSKTNTIFLMGYMGSGKSSVGLIISELLGCTYYDTDALIEDNRSMSIPEIFKNYGEQKFRDIELTTLLSLATEEFKVVSTGGGLPCSPEAIEIINHYQSVYLYMRHPQLVDRLWNLDRSTRPLLKGLQSKEELSLDIHKRLSQRESYYFSSDLITDASHAPEVVAQSILIGLDLA